MQCKDILDKPILEFLNKHCGVWCNWYFGDDKDVSRVMPEEVKDKGKLILAKMRQLNKRGLITGCFCGCRGDFEITEKGCEFLLNNIE